MTNEQVYEGPQLAGPTSYPADQAVPGPADRVPTNWMELMNECPSWT